ncbi:MAG: PTS sugar transporter subunit IIA [Planctomycetota bacterium]
MIELQSNMRDTIDAAVLIPDLSADARDAALDELFGELRATMSLPSAVSEELRAAIAERERKGSTGIGNGVAVPHVKSDDVSHCQLVIGRSAAGIDDWNAIDGRPVHLVFLIVSPKRESDRHLAILRWVSTLARQADFRRFAKDADTVESLRDLLHEMGG